MSGLGRLVVGYDRRDARSRTLFSADIAGGRCVSCGRECFFNVSAVSALGARDALPVCKACSARWPDEIREGL